VALTEDAGVNAENEDAEDQGHHGSPRL